MDRQDINLIIRIAKKYYELNMGQEQIAKSENISKSTVSRLLRKAGELNYVRTEVVYPLESVEEVEEKIASLFPIGHVFVCPAYTDDYLLRIHDTCKAFARDISALVEDDEIISVSWGRTIYSASTLLVPPVPAKRNIKIVQLHGISARNIASSKFNTIIENFSDAFLGTSLLMPAPVVVDTKEIADAIMSDTSIQTVFDEARRSEFAVFGIGEVSSKYVLVERGIYTEEEYNQMGEVDAVGDVGSQYFDINGEPVLTELMDRTIALTKEEIKKKKYRFGIAVGEHKTKAIIGALNSGIMTHFYTDEITAREVLHLVDMMGV
jgi:deoxyribonucleoside regulator